MTYTNKLWEERVWARSDMSLYVTHLTRGRKEEDKSPLDVLFEILKDKKIKGSTNSGYVSGSDPAVCFQDAPLSGIAQNIRHEVINHEKLGGKERYTAIGLMFNKPLVFAKGGRPVIYETKEFAKILPSDERWRMVTLDFSSKDNIVDWTHEREWRVKGDFKFNYKNALVILPNVDTYREFIERAKGDVLKQIQGIVNLNAVIS
ncbi:DUF2971 domain-containing protein [Lentibacillus cibarius]|uniref:DUF2971 domain-containing protein n=1 Tax=Lentibacillus cibarius TaxID=2583219 RepID=A0A5S3QLM6_9BACI|nr:DUF2971 domain-containing protein [Lentibacillus cibarius]TMN22695.1 DUF2971 domain-containing protein [Lentibacillus cibarius]